MKGGHGPTYILKRGVRQYTNPVVHKGVTERSLYK